MAEILTLRPSPPIYTSTRHNPQPSNWAALHIKFNCKPKFTCLFSDGGRKQPCNWATLHIKFNRKPKFTCLFSDGGRKQEQARKALEGALGGKKNEFEKWDKEIQKRQQSGGEGGNSGNGGWFGWFGGSNGDRFWQEAQQASLAILGIIVLYLLLTKGDVLFILILNPLLMVLRETRNGLNFITSTVLGRISSSRQAEFDDASKRKFEPASAKESVVSKWRS